MSRRTNGLGATALVFSNNIIQSDSGVILDLKGPTPNARFAGNIVFGSATNGDMPTSGARRVNPLLAGYFEHIQAAINESGHQHLGGFVP